jgi:hypothetical protein
MTRLRFIAALVNVQRDVLAATVSLYQESQ